MFNCAVIAAVFLVWLWAVTGKPQESRNERVASAAHALYLKGYQAGKLGNDPQPVDVDPVIEEALQRAEQDGERESLERLRSFILHEEEVIPKEDE